MAKQTHHPSGRRIRTTQIMVAVPTTIAAISRQLGIPAATVGKRFHDIQDRYPRRVVTLDALATYKRQPRN